MGAEGNAVVYRWSVPRLPSVELSPNFRGHWSRTHKAMQMDKSDSYAYFLQAYPRPDSPLDKARITVTVYRRTRQRLDPDNWGARMKGYWDGLVQAGLLADDSVEVIGQPRYIFVVDKQRAGQWGLVEFEVEAL